MPDQVNIIGVYDNTDFSAPIEYTFDLIFSAYGISYKIMPSNQFRPEQYDTNSVLVISYGTGHPEDGVRKHIHIYSSAFFGKNYLKPPSMPQVPLKRYEGLPIIYPGSGQLNDWVKRSDNLIETNIDIIASSFFMLSRYEEIVRDAKDSHDRFPATASLAYQEGFLDRPIVNEYIELLWGWIHSLMPNLKRKPFWPENKEFAVCLTHDVDSLKRFSVLPPVFDIGRTILKQRNPRLALNIALDYLGCLFHLKKDPLDTFDYMLDLEQRYGFKSSFYFMAGGNSKFDSSYSITKPKVKRLIQKIEGRGCEVGLHGSYDSCRDLKRMASEKERLDTVVNFKSCGCRQHYLRFRVPESWRIQERAGLLYDTTLTFADHAGFRCGICLPFKPFDVIENRILDIVELPLTVMEGSLQHPDYQNLPPQQAYEEATKLIKVIKRYQGVFVLLWHSSSFDSLGGWVGWEEVYEKVIEYIGRQNALVTSGREIIGWWKQKASN